MRQTALAALIAAVLLTSQAVAQTESAETSGAETAGAETTWHHGLSLFGAVKYPPDFKRFDYVNPDAPKGGVLRRSAIGTFDTLNPFNLKGTPGAGSGLIYDTLMTGASDEPSSEYGLIAEAVSFPDDFSSVTYRLRPQARWHDGKPITAADVVWSLQAVKEAHPQYRFYYKNVIGAEATGEHEVTFRFDEANNRELPQITGQLPVLPKHYWEGTDAKGEKRDFQGSTLEPPLGSGAYRIKEFKPARTIVYERVADYWGQDLPVNVGQNNFDEIAYEYFRDTTVLLEAFKADTFDIRFENSAKRWVTGYEFPAAERGDVILQTFQTRNAEAMQAMVFNTRRSKFTDRRVRRAFNFAFDFEWMNENVFYNQYQRINSYWENSELESLDGPPTGLELEILNEVRDLVPPEVFERKYENPKAGSPSAVRKNLREAQRLLIEAGWEVRNKVLTNTETGEEMDIVFLIVQPDSERVINPFRQNLDRLGIRSTVRAVDVSQYQKRVDDRDFDIIIDQFAQSLSPGNEQRDYWGSEAADRNGSRNTIGIKDPATEKLIDRIIFAKDRETLIAATRALDRVLLWNEYVVPQFFTPDTRTARWDRFGIPAIIPDYGLPILAWWWDAEKAAAVNQK